MPIAILSSFATLVCGQSTIDIQLDYAKGQQYRVQTKIEHVGTVIVDYPGSNIPSQHLPIDVQARLDYHQRFVGSAAKPQAVRFYDHSQAKIKLNKVSTVSELNPENQLIVSRINSSAGNQYQIASVTDMLQQRELELVKIPADPLSFAELCNKRNLKIGTDWNPTHDALARFLSVDHVIQSDVKLTLKDTNSEVAKVHIAGQIKAEIDDALTEMTIAGVLQIDNQKKLVTGLRLNVTEIRKPGQISPGFDGKTKIDLQIAESDGVHQLSNEALKAIAQSRSIRNLLKWESYNGKFALEYDPSWRLIASEDEAVVLRYAEEGDLLAQCNIVRLASRPADKPLSLSDFEKEVTKIIAQDPASRVTGANQSTTVTGLKALRVTVRGVEEDVPLNWIYYNVASPDGRQVTFVFTLEEEIVGRVEPAVKKIVDGFVFHKLESQPTNDPAAKKPATRDAKATSNETKR